MGYKHKVLSVLVTLTILCTSTCIEVYSAGEKMSGSFEISVENQAEIAEEAAADEKSTQKVPENVKNLLQTLGILDEGEAETEGNVSRGFAAEILLRVKNADIKGTATGSMYIDVPIDHQYAYAIEEASRSGYFFGTGGGTFSPDADITPTQMAKVLLRLAGYTDSAVSSGTELGKVLKNVGSYDYLTYPGLANMLYNFLDVNIIELESYSVDNPKYTKSSTETVLSHYFDVKSIKGVITENSITGLWSGSSLGKNKVIISGKDENILVDTGKTDVNLMIGRTIKLYYIYDKADDSSVCVYYDPMDDDDKVTEIDLYDIDYAESTDSKIVYYPVENKKRRSSYGVATAIIYNGTYYSDTQPILERVNGKEGKITVIDNDGDGTADVLNVEAYDTYVVKSVVLSSGAVFFKNTNQSVTLKREDYDQFIVTDLDGNEVFVEDFVDGTVVSIAQNDAGADKKAIKVLVSEQSKNGIVTDVFKNHLDKDVVCLDNMNEYILTGAVALPALRQGVILYLNAFGHVATIDYSNTGEFTYGIVTEVKFDRRSSAVAIKMITAKNTIEKFEVKEKLIVDRTTYKDMDKLYNKLYNEDNISVGNYKFPAGIYPVRYRLRTDGRLAELDTATVGDNENDNTLELLNSGKYSEKGRVMGGMYAIKDSTPVFRVRGLSSGGIVKKEFFEDTKYTSMSDASSLVSSGGVYNCAAYKVDKNSMFADFLVIYLGWGGYDYSDKLFVIEKISSVYDEATEETLMSVHGVGNGFERDVLVSPAYEEDFKALGLVCGDAIRYSENAYDHLIDVEGDQAIIKHTKDSAGKDNGIEFNNISKGQTAVNNFRDDTYATQMMYGYVLERNGDYIKLSVIPPGNKVDGTRASEDMNRETILVSIPEGIPITVYNPSEIEKVYAATYDEILDYKHSGKDCSLVALHFRSAKLIEIIVLNDYALYK